MATIKYTRAGMGGDAVIGNELTRLLTEKAHRPDMVENGFEVDQSVLDGHRDKASVHSDKSQELREALIVYHALFDRTGQQAEIKPPAGAAPSEHTSTQLWNAHFRNAEATRSLVELHTGKILDAHREQSDRIAATVKAYSDGIARQAEAVSAIACTITENSELARQSVLEALSVIRVQGDDHARGVSLLAKDNAASVRMLAESVRAEAANGVSRIEDAMSRAEDRASALLTSLSDAIISTSKDTLSDFLREAAVSAAANRRERWIQTAIISVVAPAIAGLSVAIAIKLLG